ncbi:nuclear transport factor 2 family protein [Tsuneonella sp. HG222]
MKLLAALCALALLVPAPAMAGVDEDVAALSARVERLEGERAVKKLQRAFGYYVDRGLWGEAADLFAPDGTIELGLDGVYRGNARIREYLKRLHGGQEGLVYGQLNEWVTLQPAIRVSADGRSATARWRDLGMLGQYKKHAEWRDGVFENTYEKGADGVWRIRAMHLWVNFVAPYEKGWARLDAGQGLVRSQAAQDFAPDGPSSTTYAPYPAIRTAPFQQALATVGQVAGPVRLSTSGTRITGAANRLARLEDQSAIENLQAMYGYYFDKGMWSEAAGLFSRNGSFEYGMRGIYRGQARIERAMLLFGPEGLAPGKLNNHMLLQNVVQVAPDGRTATGRWQGMVMLGEANHNGVWGVGIYENTYVKEGNRWKIDSLHFYPVAMADYDAGFMRGALPLEGVSALFPPDAPPSENYRSFPSNYVPPFSFPHPVTGQSLNDLPQPADDVARRQ